MVRGHPWLGIGAGNFTYGYTATLSPYVLSRPDLAVYAGQFTNAAHNEPLQAWVETGIVVQRACRDGEVERKARPIGHRSRTPSPRLASPCRCLPFAI